MLEPRRFRAFVWVGLLAGTVTTLGCEPEQAPQRAASATTEGLDYENPELLVDTDWLAEHRSDEGVRILDVRSLEDYEAGHVPGAVRISREQLQDPEREPGGMVGSAEQVAKAFGDGGVDEYVHVVVYDEGVSTRAARTFWTLEYYGHPRVALLNGGFDKWLAEGREMSTETPAVEPVTFNVRARPGVLSTKDRILDEMADTASVLIDARSEAEFTGEEARAERGGHIPGALHLEWTRNFTDGETPVFKPALQLAKLYDDAGITRDKRVHAY